MLVRSCELLNNAVIDSTPTYGYSGTHVPIINYCECKRRNIKTTVRNYLGSCCNVMVDTTAAAYLGKQLM